MLLLYVHNLKKQHRNSDAKGLIWVHVYYRVRGKVEIRSIDLIFSLKQGLSAEEDKRLAEIQKQIVDTTNKNRASFRLTDNVHMLVSKFFSFILQIFFAVVYFGCIKNSIM